MYKIDLNSDLGEGFGAYKAGLDDKIIPLISSANIACGFHAGDPLIMSKTVELCKQNGVRAGAHPGFPDLVGFGRRNLNASPAEVKAMMTYQVGALAAFCSSQGIKLSHVKPHGALYNMAAKDYSLAKAICEAVYEFDKDLVLLALSGSQMQKAASEVGTAFAAEVFADRAYEDDGTLVARSKPGAMITDENEAVARTVEMIKEKRVKTVNGNYISIEPHSVCVHGDSEKALLFVEKIRAGFAANGIEICPIKDIIG